MISAFGRNCNGSAASDMGHADNETSLRMGGQADGNVERGMRIADAGLLMSHPSCVGVMAINALSCAYRTGCS